MYEDYVYPLTPFSRGSNFHDSVNDDIRAPGIGIHEMGTARMGKDPRTSVLNKWNQVHTVPNVFVTDGAAMSSSPCQNPSFDLHGFDYTGGTFCGG